MTETPRTSSASLGPAGSPGSLDVVDLRGANSDGILQRNRASNFGAIQRAIESAIDEVRREFPDDELDVTGDRIHSLRIRIAARTGLTIACRMALDGGSLTIETVPHCLPDRLGVPSRKEDVLLEVVDGAVRYRYRGRSVTVEWAAGAVLRPICDFLRRR